LRPGQRPRTDEERAASQERRRERARLWARANYVARRAAAVEAAAAMPAPPPAPPPAVPPTPTATQPVIATPILVTAKQLRHWLAQSLYACGLTRLDAEDRVALMTHEEALAEANRRRALVRDASFKLIFVRKAP